LREKLLTTERELALLKSTEEVPKPAVVDDMYQRQVCGANHPVGSMADVWVNAEGGTIYSPFRGGNAMIEAFTDKVDLSQKKQALKPTNSPFLQAGTRLVTASLLESSLPLTRCVMLTWFIQNSNVNVRTG
jgi:hypothetical protein